MAALWKGFGAAHRKETSMRIEFHPPAQRWLKDRIGRTLGFDEQEEYKRIIWALMETKRLMGEIDASIHEHGGWPMK